MSLSHCPDYTRWAEQVRRAQAAKKAEAQRRRRSAPFLAKVCGERGPLTVGQGLARILARDRATNPVWPDAEYVRRLARTHGIELHEIATHATSMARTSSRIAACPPLISDAEIGTALHEIAHPVVRLSCRSPHDRTYCVECECLAWFWAMRFAPRGEWRPGYQATLVSGLSSYRRVADGIGETQIFMCIQEGERRMSEYADTQHTRNAVMAATAKRILRFARAGRTLCEVCRVERATRIVGPDTLTCSEACSTLHRGIRARRGERKGRPAC